MRIGDVLTKAARSLADAGIPESAREARSLLGFVLQRDAAFIIAHPEYDLAANEKMLFESCIRRRANHEPFQYITRRQEFYGLDFVVTPDVLIPRPETEILVEAAIEGLGETDDPEIFEIGVGSGCISIAVLKNIANARGTGVDISEAALNIARQNASMHGVDGRLTLQAGNIFAGTESRYDMIVTNPPYIPARDIPGLQPEVRDHEPVAALDGGPDGLDIVRKIVDEAPAHLKPAGHLLIEIGFDQSGPVAALFDETLWDSPQILNDLQGIPRIVNAVLKG